MLRVPIGKLLVRTGCRRSCGGLQHLNYKNLRCLSVGDATKERGTPPSGTPLAAEVRDSESITNAYGSNNSVELNEEDENEEMWQIGPMGKEWGGPTRGGRKKEPTRYGDWEGGKGRCSDF